MAKKATITPVTDTVNNAAAINTQLNAINNKLDNTLSLDGSVPNAMGADLDMNSNDILNVGVLQANDITVAGGSLTGVLASTGANKDAAAASAVDAAASATSAATSAVESAASASVSVSAAALAVAPSVFPIPSRPALVEQFVTGLHGRGMLATETNGGVATEQTISVSASVGVTSISVPTKANFTAGGMCTILHDNGLYDTYTVTTIGAGDTVAINPPLRYACTGGTAKVERLWYNRAHPGKFYMRYLAQRIARSNEIDVAMPNTNRTLFSYFDTNPLEANDTLVALGGGVLNHYDASSASAGSGHPPRFILGRSAYVTVANIGDGAETPLFNVTQSSPLIARVAYWAMGGTLETRISVLDQDGVTIASLDIAATTAQRTPTFYDIPFHPRDATQLKVSVKITNTASSNFILDMVDVFVAPETTGKLIEGDLPTIVCLGDSWIAGDLGGTAEREPITQQLALELPLATIVNAGVGGNKIQDLLARFDTDVTPYNPDYVVVCTGTNDAYNPASGVFEPNSVDFFNVTYAAVLNKITAIGARAIVIGVPALAQDDPNVIEDGAADADPNVTPYPFDNWALNDRARKYMLEFYRGLTTQPDAYTAPLTATGSYTATLTGFTTTVTGTVYWEVNNDFVTIQIPAIGGTSNSTGMSLTGMPANIRPKASTGTINGALLARDDGVNGLRWARLDTSGGMALYTTFAGGAWTASGLKGFLYPTTFTYKIGE